MRRLLTKNRIYTTFKRAMEREGLKQGWGEGEGLRPSPSYFFPLASPSQQILREQNLAKVHQDEPCSFSGEEQRLR